MFSRLITLLPRRLFNLLGFLFCAGVLGYALHEQFDVGLEPCPLCILQRIAYIITGLLMLLAAIHNAGRVGSRIHAVLIGLAALTGAPLAAPRIEPVPARNAARLTIQEVLSYE